MCNLSHTYKCLGRWAICISLPSVFPPKKFWAWAETKTGLCWGRITAKKFDKVQKFWIFTMFTCLDSIPGFVLTLDIMELIMNMWTCWRSKMVEPCQMFFCFYSASTKTNFGFCSCSELLWRKNNWQGNANCSAPKTFIGVTKVAHEIYLPYLQFCGKASMWIYM